MPIDTLSRRLVIRSRLYKRERRGSLYYSLIPCVGSRIALSQDKQLELAHAVIYCNRIQYTQRRRFGCVSFETLNLRDSHTKDYVRKRPISTCLDPLALAD